MRLHLLIPPSMKRAVKRHRLARAGYQFISAAKARTLTSVRVNLGCGADLRPGWLNIDESFSGASVQENQTPGEDTLLLQYDLAKPLPLSSSSCEIIYSSHFFEHLAFRDAVRLMRDCYRALQTGGRFRMVLPDFRSCMDAYLTNNYAYFEGLSRTLAGSAILAHYTEPGMETLIDYVNYCIYQQGEHKNMWDSDKAISVLRHVGFRSAEQSAHNDLDIGSELRKSYSFYIDALK